jgi:dynein heavy chain
MDLQRSMEAATEKRTKDTYGPPMGKKLIMFIDDLNMPRVDTYGTQQPLALLKLFMDRKGVYDRGKELNWKKMMDILPVAAMGPPGGARNNVDPRVIPLYNVFEIQFPAMESLELIYESILKAHTAILNEEIAQAASTLTATTLALYQYICEKLPPTPSRFHYIFNLRDLSRVYEGLMLSCVDKVDSPEKFIRLWRHECMRIFHDRLISADDKAVFVKKLDSLVQEKFGAFAEHANANPILFGDFRNVMKNPAR